MAFKTYFIRNSFSVMSMFRAYLGDRIGVYFAYMQFYAAMLTLPTLLGIITFIYGCTHTSSGLFSTRYICIECTYLLMYRTVGSGAPQSLWVDQPKCYCWCCALLLTLHAVRLLTMNMNVTGKFEPTDSTSGSYFNE